MNEQHKQPILITGATGTLGNAFAMVCDMRGINYRLSSRQEMDIANVESVEKFLEDVQPAVMVNTAGYSDIDAAEKNSRACYRENTLGNIILADACKRRGIRYVTFSCDLVFDGRKRAPYLESDAFGPLSIYGRSKVRAERCVTQILSDALVVRTSGLFSNWDGKNFLAVMEKEILRGNLFYTADDMIVSPSYAPDVVNATLDLLQEGASGIYHLTNQGEISWYDFALLAAAHRGLETKSILPRPLKDFLLAAERPAYSALGSEKIASMPTLDDALRRYAKEQELLELSARAVAA